MADVHDKATRSYNMSQIKGKNTKPEALVRRYLFAEGFRFRKNDKRYLGTPDIVFPKYKTMVFINGCFWHGHEGCRYFIWPENNADFWQKKIISNIERDKNINTELEQSGWHVITIWECQLKRNTMNDTLKALKSELLDQLK